MKDKNKPVATVDDQDQFSPHKPKIENEKPGQSAVGKHSKTQREKNEERDLRATR